RPAGWKVPAGRSAAPARRPGLLSGLGLFLLGAQLLLELLAPLLDLRLDLLLLGLEIGLLQRLAIIGVGEALERDLDRVRLVLEIDRGDQHLAAALERA